MSSSIGPADKLVRYETSWEPQLRQCLACKSSSNDQKMLDAPVWPRFLGWKWAIPTQIVIDVARVDEIPSYTEAHCMLVLVTWFINHSSTIFWDIALAMHPSNFWCNSLGFRCRRSLAIHIAPGLSHHLRCEKDIDLLTKAPGLSHHLHCKMDIDLLTKPYE